MKSREREAYLPGSGNTEDSSNNGFGLGGFPLLFCPLIFFSFPVSPSLYFLWLPLRLSVRGERVATRVAANTGLEEDDDEGAVAGQSLLSPLYNLPPSVHCFFSLISSVSLRRNRGMKVNLFSPLPP